MSAAASSSTAPDNTSSGVKARLASLTAPAESELNRWKRTFDKHAGVEVDGKK